MSGRVGRCSKGGTEQFFEMEGRACVEGTTGNRKNSEVPH